MAQLYKFELLNEDCQRQIFAYFTLEERIVFAAVSKQFEVGINSLWKTQASLTPFDCISKNGDALYIEYNPQQLEWIKRSINLQTLILAFKDEYRLYDVNLSNYNRLTSLNIGRGNKYIKFKDDNNLPLRLFQVFENSCVFKDGKQEVALLNSLPNLLDYSNHSVYTKTLHHLLDRKKIKSLSFSYVIEEANLYTEFVDLFVNKGQHLDRLYLNCEFVFKTPLEATHVNHMFKSMASLKMLYLASFYPDTIKCVGLLSKLEYLNWRSFIISPGIEFYDINERIKNLLLMVKQLKSLSIENKNYSFRIEIFEKIATCCPLQ